MATNSKEYNKKNYKKYWGSDAAKKDRAKRNAVRRKALKDGKVKKGDDLEVDHINGIKGGNGKKNLRVIKRKTNRQLGAKKANRAKSKKKNTTDLYYV